MKTGLRTRFCAVALLAVFSASGCSQESAPTGSVGSTPPAAPPAPPAPPAKVTADANAALAPDDPCRLLTNAELQAVIPQAKPGARDRTREEYGIRTCAWQTPSGHFAVQEWQLKGGTLDNEIRGLVEGVLDPRSSTAHAAIRYESIAGVGDEALAVVESKDEQRGILSDVAILVARHGTQLLEMDSSDLAQRDRASALKALTTLGKTAISRL